MIDNILDKLNDNLISEYDKFALADNGMRESCEYVLKELFHSMTDISDLKFGPHKKISTNLDASGIWETLQSRNKPLLRFVKKKIRLMNQNQNKQEVEEEEAEEEEERDAIEEEDSMEEQDDDNDDEYDDDGDSGSTSDQPKEDFDEGENDDEEEEEEKG